MADEPVANGTGGETAPAVTPIPAHSPGGTGAISPRDAANSLTDWRRKQNAGASNDNVALANDNAAPKQSEGEEPDDTGLPDDQDATGETQEAKPEEKLPAIEPPRSWTAEQRERWQSLPRETQEYVAERESAREREISKAQREAAEARKSIDGDRARLEQARQQYEAALPALLQTLQQQQQGEFADIKTIQDVERLAREDWPRYALWDAHNKKIAAVAQETQAAQQRQRSEFSQQWAAFAKKQDELVYEKAPELTDKVRAQAVADQAINVLKDIGFSNEELTRAYNGEEALSIRDHRLQLLILDAVKYREAKASVAKPAAKTLPPVQRPGAAQPANVGLDAQIRTLEKQLTNTSGMNAMRLGAQLIALKRQQSGGR